MDKEILQYAADAYSFIFLDGITGKTCGQLADEIKKVYSLSVAQNAAVYQCLMRHENEILERLI